MFLFGMFFFCFFLDRNIVKRIFSRTDPAAAPRRGVLTTDLLIGPRPSSRSRRWRFGPTISSARTTTIILLCFFFDGAREFGTGKRRRGDSGEAFKNNPRSVFAEATALVLRVLDSVMINPDGKSTVRARMRIHSGAFSGRGGAKGPNDPGGKILTDLGAAVMLTVFVIKCSTLNSIIG